MAKYKKDRKKEMEKVAKPVIRRYFPDLKHAKILFIWRDPPRKDDGRLLAGRARILPVRERDLYGFDFEIEISEKVWKAMSKAGKRQLIWHELRHCAVMIEDDEDSAEPARDKEGRLLIYIEDHDIDIRSFSEEYKMFGIPSGDLVQIKKMYQIYKNRRSMKRIKRLVIDEEEVLYD